jgi:hypothetical protein
LLEQNYTLAQAVELRQKLCCTACKFPDKTCCCRMDQVLVLISRAARFPPPVRTSATQALGEFRKTQESTESSPLKERLKLEVWESIREVGESTYFA